MNKNSVKDFNQLFIELENKKHFDFGISQVEDVSFEILYDFKHELDLNGLLEFGVKMDNVDFCKKMIRLGADINRKARMRDSLLNVACRNNCNKTAKLLLDHNVDVNTKSTFDYTPLIIACLHKSYKCIQLLVESGADINQRNIFEESALDIAKNQVNKKLIDLLIQNGAHE